MTREQIVRHIRDEIGTSECDNPITFDPPDWAVRAVERAYRIGHGDGERYRQAELDAQHERSQR